MVTPFFIVSILFLCIVTIVPLVFWGVLLSLGPLCDVYIDNRSWVAQKLPKVLFCYTPENQQKKHL